MALKFSVQECAYIYEALLENIYRLTLENGTVLEIRFKKEYFKNLVGLHKLTDIRHLPGMDPKRAFKEILSGSPLVPTIQKSARYFLIENRVNYFYFLPSLLHGKIVVDFDTRLVDGETLLQNTDIILYRKIGSGYVHLTIGENLECHYPETFFFEPTKKYISGQNLLDIIKTEIVFTE